MIIKWWDWPDEMIKARIADFFGPMDEFVKKYRPEID